MPKININGTQLHYHVAGRGTPILFIHPPLVNRAIFRYQEVQLSDSHQVITFDIRGHGFSPPSESPVTYPLIVEDMKCLLDHLEISKAYLCGYSTGGGVTLEMMLSYPDRVKGAILIGGMSEVSDWWTRRQIGLAASMAKSGMKTSLALALARGNADMKDTFHNLYYEAIRGDIRNWQQYFEESLNYNCTNRLNGIHAPVLLVYGDKDRRFHRYGSILHRLLPNSKLVYIPQVKHNIPTKAAGPFHDLIAQWVKERESLSPTRQVVRTSLSPENKPAADPSVAATLGLLEETPLENEGRGI